MVLRFHGLYFMLFVGRNYMSVSFEIGYDDWSKDLGFKLVAPFLMVSFGYEFNRDIPMIEDLEEAMNGGNE